MDTTNSRIHRPSRRQFFGAATGLTGLTLIGQGCGGRSNPNILWIIAEDFSPDLGCYGNKDVHTPNIDQLASEGMRFTNAFMTAPVCSAARSALAVGMYQTSVGGHNHRSHRDDGFKLPEGVHVFTHYLREAGYHTSNLRRVEGIGGTGKTDFNYDPGEEPFDAADWTARAEGQPFYAQINFTETHRAFKRFPDRPVNPDTLTSLPPYYPDDPAVRLDWATYLDDAQHLDRNVGKVLQRLKDQNLWDNTAVFFFSDHGRPMPRGKQFLYDGGIHIPLVARIPGKYQLAGYHAGSLYEDFVSSIDITATTLRLAGVDVPEHLEGRPFFGPGVEPREYIVAARDRCDETVDRIRAVRDHEFKYIKNFYPERAYTQQNIYKETQYATLAVMHQLQEEGKLTGPPALFMADKRPPEELYDIRKDPHEINNLADSPEYAEELKKMRARLDQWIEETKDKGEIPEPEEQSQDDYRKMVDGWCTRNNASATKTGGHLKVETFGNGASLLRGYVAEGEDLTLEFRARSNDAAVASVSWGTIEDLRNPSFKKDVDFKTDGSWHDYSIDFTAKGYLAQLTFDFSGDKGAVEYDWIRLLRKKAGKTQKVKQWDFA